jgi:hypothetical protein
MPLLTELENLFRIGSTNMPRLRRFLRSNTAWQHSLALTFPAGHANLPA